MNRSLVLWSDPDEQLLFVKGMLIFFKIIELFFIINNNIVKHIPKTTVPAFICAYWTIFSFVLESIMLL